MCVALSSRYSEFNGRYLLPAVVVAMPLVASTYRHRILAAAIAGIGLTTLLLVHIDNERKPTGADGGRPIWSMTRTEARTVGWRQMAQVIQAVERTVPADGTLGYVLSYNDWIYPFYGDNLARRLIKVPRNGLFAAAERRDLNVVIVTGSAPEPAPGWRAIHFPIIDPPAIKWTLLVRCTCRSSPGRSSSRSSSGNGTFGMHARPASHACWEGACVACRRGVFTARA